MEPDKKNSWFIIRGKTNSKVNTDKVRDRMTGRYLSDDLLQVTKKRRDPGGKCHTRTMIHSKTVNLSK
jgi:hypothetical protein